MKILEQHPRKWRIFYSVEDQNKVLIFSALGLKLKSIKAQNISSSKPMATN
jgi:hypothetical protein